MHRSLVPASIVIAAVAGVAVASAWLKPRALAARIITGQTPCSENGGLGYLWVSNFRDATIVRIDPATNRVTARIKVGARPCGVAVGAGSVWVDSYGTDNIERVDPQTRQVVARILVGPSPYPAATAFGDVWVPVSGGRQVVRFHVG